MECLVASPTQGLAKLQALAWCFSSLSMALIEFLYDSIGEGYPSALHVHRLVNYAAIVLLAVLLVALLVSKRVAAHSTLLMTIGSCCMTCYIGYQMECLVAMGAEYLNGLGPPSPTSPQLQLFANKSRSALDLVIDTPGDLLGMCVFVLGMYYNFVQASFTMSVGLLPTSVCALVQLLVCSIGPALSRNRYGSVGFTLSLSVGVAVVMMKHAWIVAFLSHRLHAADQRELGHQKAMQKADSVLNHMLKNNLVDSRSCIWMYLDGIAEADRATLSLGADLMTRSLWWCRLREALIRIVSNRCV